MIMAAAKRFRAPVAFIFLSFFLALSAAAEETTSQSSQSSTTPNFPYKTIQTKEGLVFRVPADMPIQMKDGIQVPAPFDEYIYGKFAALDSKIAEMEEHLVRIEQKLDRLTPLVGAVSPKSAQVEVSDSAILKAGIE